jgi:hypothetical protein
MGFGNHHYQPSLDSNGTFHREYKQQITYAKLTTWRIIIRLLCGLFLILIYSIIYFQALVNSSIASHCINISSMVLHKRLNVSAVSTGPNVPLVTVNLYYLPLNSSNMTIDHTLREHTYESRQNGLNYPIGAYLVSNPSEYTIPSDRSPSRRNDHGFKYFREMPGDNHLDARFGKPMSKILSNAQRAAIFRGLLATW